MTYIYMKEDKVGKTLVTGSNCLQGVESCSQRIGLLSLLRGWPDLSFYADTPTAWLKVAVLPLALLATGHNLKASALEAFLRLLAGNSTRCASRTALLRNLTPASAGGGGGLALDADGGRLLDDHAFLSESLAADKLLSKVTTVHRGRVGVDCIRDDTSVKWEHVESGLEVRNYRKLVSEYYI